MTESQIKRQYSLIEKWGSLEAYEKQRKEKIRKTFLKKCKTNEELQERLKKYEWEDFCEETTDKTLLGKEVSCKDCNSVFIAKNNTTYCKSCLLKHHRIIKYGNYENFKKSSTENLKKSLLKIYGVDNPTKNKEICKKAVQTKKEKYGENLEKIVEKIEKTKEEKYGDKNYNNSEKRAKTNISRYGNSAGITVLENTLHTYGIDNIMKLEKFKEKAVQTKKEKYGENLEKIVEKIEKTKEEKYGDKNYTNSEKAKQTMLKKYGVENYQQSEEGRQKLSQRTLGTHLSKETKEKIEKTFLERYGGFNVKCLYDYRNKVFDSSWELYFYIYLIDHNICFEYKPQKLEYFDNKGLSHYYYPDFKINDTLVEIKGDHLINKNQNLIDFNNIEYPEKTKFLKSLGTVILTSKELFPVFNYVDSKYGKSFIKSFKRERS